HTHRATQPAPAVGRRNTNGDEAWRLTTVAGRTTLIVGDEGRQPVAVDAGSGRVVTAVSREDALAAARHFAQGTPVRWIEQVTEDAWTHSRALDGHRPLHVVAVDEPQERWLYVSSRTGEVVRDASLVERSWGWVGAWLHWLYLFRGGVLDPWWTDIVIWLAVAGSISALTGIVVGIWRWRFRSTYRNGRHTPYLGRAARWHHLAGMAGGLLAFTWVLSGLFSMNPWKVFDAPGPKPDRRAYAGAVADPQQAPDPTQVLQRLSAQGLAARELTWHRVGGLSLAQAHGGGAPRLFSGADAQPLDQPAPAIWLDAATRLLPGARVQRLERLDHYDAWYYAREPHTMGGHRERPLPVVRLRFDDPNGTWVVIDPRNAAIVQISDGHRRVDRWLFAFLHSFDLPPLLAARPGWDLWMLGFSLAGCLLAATAVVTGTRRLLRVTQRGRPKVLTESATTASPR
ncbi:MAG TPA: PepSY domain-containing protein, partial [Rubrivivax sp.]|nr:PepSY domain-containing protein [Rubrivivax sp.]